MRLVATGLAAGFAVVACTGAESQPPAGARHVDGVVGLRFRREGLDRELGRSQRLGVEPLGDIVALADRIRVALRRGQAEPFEGFGEVLFDADAAGIEDAEVELAVGDAAIGRLAEPLRRALVVGALAAAVGVEHGQIMHRLGVAALGGLHVIAPRDIDVLLHAEALLVEGPEPEDRRHHAGLRRAVVPFRGFVEIRGHAFAFGEAHADLVGRGRIALQRGGAQHRSADRLRQPFGRRHLHLGELAAGRRSRLGRNRAGDIAGGVGEAAGIERLRDRRRCGIATVAVPSGAALLNDCRPIGVGEVIEGVAGAGSAGLALSCAGGCAAGACSIELSIAGIGGAVAAVEQRHRHLEGAEHDHDHARADQQRADLGGDGRRLLVRILARPCRSLGLAGGGLERAATGLVGGRRGGGGLRGAARGGDEARGADRLAALAGISLIALSEAAMRSDGVAARPVGRVPGSSG